MNQNFGNERRDFLKNAGLIGAIAAIGVGPIVGLEATTAEAVQSPAKPKITRADVEKMQNVSLQYIHREFGGPKMGQQEFQELKERTRGNFYKLTELHGYQIVDG